MTAQSGAAVETPSVVPELFLGAAFRRILCGRPDNGTAREQTLKELWISGSYSQFSGHWWNRNENSVIVPDMSFAKG